jgi:transcription factor Dp-1
MADVPRKKSPVEASRKRSADDSSQASQGSSKKRASPKTTGESKQPGGGATGLRHFSMKVCRKVEEKGATTYNEVADELVRDVLAERSPTETKKFDEKNIRRRVYDALNVLMAMDIISKDKKDIRWKGLPSNVHHDLDMLQREGQFRRAEVERKRESLRELLVQQVCFRNLVQHNQRREAAPSNEEKIPLPFIVVNTNSSAVIQCEMSPDRTDVMFDFSMPFEINDDNTILKRLGMYVMFHCDWICFSLVVAWKR